MVNYWGSSVHLYDFTCNWSYLKLVNSVVHCSEHSKESVVCNQVNISEKISVRGSGTDSRVVWLEIVEITAGWGLIFFR